MRGIFGACIHNTTLQEIELNYGAEIGDSSISALAKALEVNTTLTTLNLEANEVGDGGATALAEALKTNTTLTQLDLRGNSLGDESGMLLAEALVDPLPGMPKLPRAAVVDVYPEAADAMGRACGGATAGPVGMPNKLKESLRGRFCAMVSRHNAPHAHAQHPPAFYCQFRILQGRSHPVARPQAWCA
mgnify:CR=1 FL=1